MQLFANNIETTLVASLSSSATTMYVASTSGIPNPTGDDYFLLTLCKRDSSGVESSIEIVKCTAISSNQLTIVRAQEGTSGTAYASGDIVSLRLTAGTLNSNIMQADGLPLAIGRINNPLLHLPLKNSLDMVCGAGSVTFTRASSATYIDRYGVVQKVGNDVARFEKEGLLIEGVSTNKCLQSEDFSSGSWLKSNCSISVNVIDAPDGTTTADGIIADTSNTDHRVRQESPTGITSKIVTGSVFIKKGDMDWVQIIMNCYDSTLALIANGSAYFDISTGVVGTTSAIANSTTIAKIEELVDDWYRCSITITYSGSATPDKWLLYVYPAEADENCEFTGDDSTVNIYLWGAQIEEMPFATSYIPTTTAAATRAADNCSVTYVGNMPAPNTEEMTIIVDGCCEEREDDSFPAFYDISGLNYTRAYFYAISSAKVYFKDGVSDLYSSISDLATKRRYGVVINNTNKLFYVDGVLGASRSKETITGTGTVITLGRILAGNFLYGHISNFRIYSEALTEAEMRIA